MGWGNGLAVVPQNRSLTWHLHPPPPDAVVKKNESKWDPLQNRYTTPGSESKPEENNTQNDKDTWTVSKWGHLWKQMKERGKVVELPTRWIHRRHEPMLGHWGDRAQGLECVPLACRRPKSHPQHNMASKKLKRRAALLSNRVQSEEHCWV